MKVSNEGAKFIRDTEDFLAVAKQDGRYFSIGFGHTGPDVEEGMKITRAKALSLFAEDLVSREDAVNESVKVPLTQNEFDALVSLTYNIGIQAFKDSKVLRRLNQGDRIPAADHILRWNLVDGEVSGGLVKRRAAEKALFLGADFETAIKVGELAYADHNVRV